MTSSRQQADLFQIAVDGLEATQATQFYRSFRHLDAATAEPDNAVPLIAGKPLAIRVYPDLRSPADWQGEARVGGELAVRRAGANEPWQPAARFPGAVSGQPARLIDRGNPAHALNFRIAQEFAHGELRVRARVWVELPETGDVASDWFERTFSFVETRPLRLRLHGVHYRGEGLDVPPPAAAEVLQTLSYLRKTYPVSRIDIVSYDTLDFSGNLAERGGDGCGRAWSELLLLLCKLRAASVSTDPHYALLPNGAPRGACGGYGTPLGVGASYVGEGSTMAQELGHVFHRRHAPGGGVDDPDPEYPAYANYPSGSIGEYGLDPVTGRIFSPTSSHDFMSYCGNYWVSPYTYRSLLPLFARQPAAGAMASEKDGGEDARHLHVGFCVGHDHRFELESGLSLSGPPIPSHGDPTPFRLEIRDGDDRVLCSRTARLRGGRLDSQEDLHFLESLPLHPRARRLVFRCCERHDPRVFPIPESELQVEIVEPLGPPGELREGFLALSWNVTCEEAERISFFVRYSCDGGTSWKPIDIGLAWRNCQVDIDRLPGGDDCRLQVIASTILQTATAETVSFRVRRKPRRAAIAGPDRTVRIREGAALELTGTAHSPEGFAADSDLRWFSNLQGRLGEGTHLSVHDLVPGGHEITLVAPDGLGSETRDRIVVHVSSTEGDEPREDRR